MLARCGASGNDGFLYALAACRLALRRGLPRRELAIQHNRRFGSMNAAEAAIDNCCGFQGQASLPAMLRGKARIERPVGDLQSTTYR
jgi:hypothetical protein